MLVTSIMLCNNNRNPVGHITFTRKTSCICCDFDPSSLTPTKTTQSKFYCFFANTQFDKWTITWEKFCTATSDELAGATINEIDSIGQRVV